MSRDLRWSSDDTFTLDDTAFRLAPWVRPARDPIGSSSPSRPSQGGSAAFFAHLLRPSAFLALDILDQPVTALAEFVEARGYADTMHLAYSAPDSRSCAGARRPSIPTPSTCLRVMATSRARYSRRMAEIPPARRWVHDHRACQTSQTQG